MEALSHPDQPAPLALIVDDEALLALEIEDLLMAEGSRTLIAYTEAEVKTLAVEHLAVAVVDLSLGGELAGQRVYRTRLSGHLVGLCGAPEVRVEPRGTCIKRAAVAVLLDQPLGIVAGGEGADGVAVEGSALDRRWSGRCGRGWPALSRFGRAAR